MPQTDIAATRMRISAVFTALLLVLGFFSINPAGAHALSAESAASAVSALSEDADSFDVDGDSEQGVGKPFTRIPEERIIKRSDALRCVITQSTSAECAPYIHGQTLSASVFAEGSEYDADMETASLNSRGRETLCFVGTKAMPCSKLFNLANEAGTQGDAAGTVRTDANAGLLAEDDEYVEQRAVITPIGGCPLAASSPCYSARNQ